MILFFWEDIHALPPIKDFETLPKGRPLLLVLPALLGVAGVEGCDRVWTELWLCCDVCCCSWCGADDADC